MTNTPELCAQLLEKQCPKYYERLKGIANGMQNDDLDLLGITSGMEGGGKSNVILVSDFALAYLLNKPISITKDWFFSGAEYLKSLQNIAMQIVRAAGYNKNEFLKVNLQDIVDDVDIESMIKIKNKFRHTFRILDESQDLMHFDAMNRFNKGFTKTMMAIRDLNLLFEIAYPDITMLNRYLRAFRVKIFKYCFILPNRKRVMALYDRIKYIRVITDSSRNIQLYTLLGDKFINRYCPSLLVQNIPLFPKETKEWKRYYKLKKLSMARGIFLNSNFDENYGQESRRI